MPQKNIIKQFKTFSNNSFILLLINYTMIIHLTYIYPTYAQNIISDNTMNTEININDKTYTVSGGKIIDDINQFHSFESFSLNNDETVNFIGPDSIKNIISRVTGLDKSIINGRLKSDINGANMFFLNPNGIVFGSDAILDIKGSFYVSTSDYLKMNDNSKFYVSKYQSSVLSSAEPTAFGFIDNSIESITFEKRTSSNFSGISVEKGNSIGVIGGDIEFKVNESNENRLQNTNTLASIYAPSGHIHLLSVASEGEIGCITKCPALSTIKKYGNINLSDNSTLDVSGNGKGSIFLKAGDIKFDNSHINSKSQGEYTGYGINLYAENILFTNGSTIKSTSYGEKDGAQVTISALNSVIFKGENSSGESTLIDSTSYGIGNSSKISIESKYINFNSGAKIVGSARGSGYSGDVILTADYILFDGISNSTKSSNISLDTYSTGNAGHLIMDAKHITFMDSSYIASSSFNKGMGGKITLLASDTIHFQGKKEINEDSVCRIYSATYYNYDGAGDAGTIELKSKNIIFENGAFITASTIGKGNGGQILLDAKESVILKGISLDNKPTQLKAIVMKKNDPNFDIGNGGSITINSKKLIIENGAEVMTCSYGKGKAGYIDITTDETIIDNGANVKSSSESIGSNQEAGEITVKSRNYIRINNNSYISTSTNGTDVAGKVNIITDNLSLDNTAKIISSSEKNIKNAGNAGLINIDCTGKIKLHNKSKILTESLSSGGGKISIKGKNLILLSKSIVSTSVKDFSGDGGNISINSKIVALKNSGINADSYKGNGGAINIVADHFIEDPENSVTAISVFGKQGTVSIKSPNEDIKLKILDLNTNFLSADKWLKTPCVKRQKSNYSQLIFTELFFSPSSINDLRESPYIDYENDFSAKELTTEVKDLNNSILNEYSQIANDFLD